MLKSKPYLHVLAAVLFCILTLGMTWPLVCHLDTHVTPGFQPALTVPYFNLWTLAWNYRWLQGEVDNYWDANQFFPHRKTLAYSEPQFGTSLLTYPTVGLGGNTVLAYNVATLLFFFGAGMAVYALCWWVLGLMPDVRESNRCAAAITAGILFAFNPYMFRELGVLQLLATLFPALCLLGLHRFFHKKRLSDALLFTAGFLGCWHTCAYYGLFLSVFVACFPFLFWHRDLFRWRHLMRGFVALAISIAGLLPLAYGMQSAKVAMSLDRSEEIVRALSAVLRRYLEPSSSSLIYKHILGEGVPGSSLFLGGMLLCLSVVGTFTLFKSHILRWNGQSDSETLAVSNPTRLPSFRRYSIFYITMACVAFILSMGMAFTPIHTKGLGIYRIIAWFSPYNLLYKFVPGFSSIRSPYRFSIFLALFLAILAGVGVLWICRRFRSRWRWPVVVCLIGMSLFELWPVPVRLIKVPVALAELPPVYQHVKKLPSDTALIEVPLPTLPSEEGLEPTARYIYYSTFHWQRLVNGYSGFSPRAEDELIKMFAEPKHEDALSALRAFGVEYILAHWNDMSEPETVLLRTLESDGSLKPVYCDGSDQTLYRMNTPQREDTPPELPEVERLAIYENGQESSAVTLCFYYEMEPEQMLLVTPWQHLIECDVSWYKDSAKSVEENDEPMLTKNVSFKGSELLHVDSNAIAMDVPAPAPGKYQVVVRHRLASHSVTKTGVCEIYPHGFVRFHEDP